MIEILRLRVLRLTSIFILFSAPLFAATYHVDPARGKMSNPGTADRPWSTLEAVFAARKSFAGGDVILLRNGYHGSPVIRGHNRGTVTIRPDKGHQPKVRELVFERASRWEVVELDISPLHTGDRKYDHGRHVEMKSDSSHITLRDCHIRSVFSVRGWSEKDWKNKRLGTAVYCRAPHSVISGNRIENVAHGITVSSEAEHTRVEYNVLDTVRDDGFRGLASHCVFAYNTLTNMYGVDGHHDDAFQSWSRGPGKGVIRDVVLRGNVFISCTDPKQPFKSAMQGIGCFDGIFEDFVIENNVIVTDQWHGISLYGARNCRIVNNTVIKTPSNVRKNAPWIQIERHKNGSKSSGNVVRNNIATAIRLKSGSSSSSHNLETKDFARHFADFTKLDLRLKAGSAAISAGTTSGAPKIDALLKPRSGRVDLGAHQYEGAVSSAAKASKETRTAVATESPTAGKQSASKREKEKKSAAKTAAAKPARFEAEKLSRRVRGAGARETKQGGASGGAVVIFNGKRKGNSIELTTGQLAAGQYTVKVRYQTARGRGEARASFAGKDVGSTINFYGSNGRYEEADLGTVEVRSAGKKKLRLTVTGKDRRASGYRLAVDRVTFSPR